jgi:hypothetical protein
VRGRGATAARRDAGTNTYVVTFDRDITQCTYTATPTGSTTAQTLSIRAGGNPNNVRVDADQNDTTGFHLQVIC